MGGAWFHPESPFAHGRDLDDTKYAVDHFFAKLLGLPETMQTGEGRVEAQRRRALLRTFLNALADELEEPRP